MQMLVETFECSIVLHCQIFSMTVEGPVDHFYLIFFQCSLTNVLIARLEFYSMVLFIRSDLAHIKLQQL